MLEYTTLQVMIIYKYCGTLQDAELILGKVNYELWVSRSEPSLASTKGTTLIRTSKFQPSFEYINRCIEVVSQ